MSNEKKPFGGCLLSTLLFISAFGAAFFPLYFLFADAHPWVRILVCPVLTMVYLFGQQAYPIFFDAVLTILYCITLPKVLDLPTQAYSIAYYVFCILFVIFFLIPTIISLIPDRCSRERKRIENMINAIEEEKQTRDH